MRLAFASKKIRMSIAGIILDPNYSHDYTLLCMTELWELAFLLKEYSFLLAKYLLSVVIETHTDEVKYFVTECNSS